MFDYPSGFSVRQRTMSEDASGSDSFSYEEETRLLKKSKDERVKKKYPLSIFFIIGNEFCERFTFYGLRTVLTLYLTQRLMYSDNTGTIIYHVFAMLAYFMPIFGAIIADSWLGKYYTILYISFIYCIGSIILSIGSAPHELDTMKTVSLLGLFVIAVGTGGIKPCVSAFGGDQFEEGQEKQRQQFFSLFYLSINMGSVLSTFLTPVLRADVYCFNEKSCYPLAFGVPALLMIVALLLFICGKPFYKLRPPEGNIVLKVFRCICHALGNKCKGKSEKKKDHWLDYADDKFDKNLIRDIKILLPVLVLYIPLPFFWALFDQQGSRWTLQAARMDGEVAGYHIKADQLQVMNPLLIIAFIPLFDYCIYPLLGKCRFLTRPLQRITAGGILAALSFIVAGFIELHLESRLPVFPPKGYSELTIINNAPCPVRINELPVLDAFQENVISNITIGDRLMWNFVPENCSGQVEPMQLSFNTSKPIESMMITLQDGQLQVIEGNDTKVKSSTGEPKIRIFYNIYPLMPHNITFMLVRQDKNAVKQYIGPDTSITPFGTTEYCTMPPGRYNVYISHNETAYQVEPIGTARFLPGAIYILSIYEKPPENRTNFQVYEMVKGNSVHILLQIPQYVIITAGEIMFSITGLEFSYSQSPLSMKSVVQAAWLLTVAFGNLIVLIIAKLSLFEKQSYELFLFATLMGVDMVIFAIIAYFYKYATIADSDSIPLETSTTKGATNEAFEDETDLNK